MNRFALWIAALQLAGCTMGAQWQMLESAAAETVRIQAVTSYEITPDDSNWGRMFGGSMMTGTYYSHDILFADSSTRQFDMKAQYFKPGTCLSVKRSKQCVDQCKPGVNLQVLTPVTCTTDLPQGKSTTLIQ